MKTIKEIFSLFILVFLILIAVPSFSHSESLDSGIQTTGSVQKGKKFEIIERVYRLVCVSPQRVKKKLKKYIIEFSVLKEPDIIRVKLEKKNIKIFEKKLLDLENEDETLVGHKVDDFTDKILSLPVKIFTSRKKKEKKIFFKIYTVLASKEEGDINIEDKALREVVEELKNLMNFKSFTMDSFTTITAGEGLQNLVIEIPSRFSGLKLNLDLIKVIGEKSGSREILIDRLILWDGREPIISTRTSAKEGGHLVVGVTQVGVEQYSLILIMQASVK